MVRDDVARAREMFLSGAEPDRLVRPAIARSWRRTQHLQVSATSATPPFATGLDPEAELIRAAEPVLRSLADRLASSTCGVLLADGEARIRWRWTSERSVMRALDVVGSDAGASLAEVDVGTNGLGTVIEERAPMYVQWAEHYAAMYQPFVCAGAPIWSSPRDRIEGVVTVVSLDDRHGRMLRLARSAAEQIARRLTDERWSDARALLDTLTAATARTTEPVAIVGDELFMASPAAAESLDVGTAGRLITLGRHLTAGGAPVGPHLGDTASTLGVDPEPVLRHGRQIGMLFRLPVNRPSRTAHAPAPLLSGLDGDAAAWLRVQRLAQRRAVARRRLLIEGERGVGKRALTQALVASGAVPGPLRVADTDVEPMLGTADWLRDLASQLAAGGTVLVRRPELLSAPAVRAVVALLDRHEGGPVVVLTTHTVGDLDPALHDRFGSDPVIVPPLRSRRGDVMALLAAADRRVGRPTLRLTREARAAFDAYGWPGNVRELLRVAEDLAFRVDGRPVALDDLPTAFRQDPRPQGELAALERRAVTVALRASRGNRTEAARTLGIARSTLYRKARALGVPLPPSR